MLLKPDLPPDVVACGIMLERAANRHRELLQGGLEPFVQRGIRNVEDFRFLALLRRRGELTVTQATAELSVTKAATAARAERLRGAGLIVRRSIQLDRRSNVLLLANDAIQLVDDAFDAVVGAHVEFLGALNPTELSALDVFVAKLLPER